MDALEDGGCCCSPHQIYIIGEQNLIDEDYVKETGKLTKSLEIVDPDPMDRPPHPETYPRRALPLASCGLVFVVFFGFVLALDRKSNV